MGYLDNIWFRKHYIEDIEDKFKNIYIKNTNPGNHWIDGHPLGNGDIGIMVTGNPESLKFYSSKSDIWDNRTVNNNRSVFPKEKYKDILKIVENNDRNKFQEINKKMITDYSKTNFPSPQLCGLLEFKFKNSGYNGFIQTLNLYNGNDNISWKTDRGQYNINCFVHQFQNIVEYEIDYSGENEDSKEISLYRMPSDLYQKETFFYKDNFIGFEFIFPDGLKYINLIYIDLEKINITEDYKITIADGKSSNIRIIQTIMSSNESNNPREAAFKKISKYLEEDKVKKKEESNKFWIDFWNRSYIDIKSKEMEMLWYTGLYLIGCSSRKGSPAMPGLQGVWIDNYSPPWKGDYHTDLNIQMNYWPTYISNHLDISEPFYRCYNQMIPKFKKDTKDYFQMEGIKIPLAHDLKGNELGGYLAGLLWQSSTAWIASHFWKNYKYSQDKDFLKNIAYPFMEESIKFYNSILRKKNGRYIVYLSWSPEEMEADQIKAIDNNPTIDISLIKSLYSSFIKTVDILRDSITLNVDMDLVKDIYNNLSDYSRKDGYITESEKSNYDYSHRHLSVLTPVYPSGEFNSHNCTEDDYRLGLNTFYKYIKRGNSSKRMYMSLTYTWLACVSAVLGLKDFVNIYLNDFMDTVVNNNFLNVSFDYKKKGRGINKGDTQDFSAGTKYEFEERIFQLESNTCAAEAINLMLLQSFGGVITIFPSYPFETGCFEGLRAEGGFIVSSKLKDNKIDSLFILSLYGNECSLSLDKNIHSISIINITDSKNIKISKIMRNHMENKVIYCFDTIPDNEYEIIINYN